MSSFALKEVTFVSVTYSQGHPAQPLLRVGDLSTKCHRQPSMETHESPTRSVKSSVSVDVAEALRGSVTHPRVPKGAASQE